MQFGERYRAALPSVNTINFGCGDLGPAAFPLAFAVALFGGVDLEVGGVAAVRRRIAARGLLVGHLHARRALLGGAFAFVLRRVLLVLRVLSRHPGASF